MDIREHIRQRLQECLVLEGIKNDGVLPHLERPADLTHGDFASNVAMTLFKGSQYQQPRQLAAAIVQRWNETSVSPNEADPISKVEVAGPGFINFYLSEHYLWSEIQAQVASQTLSLPDLGHAKKVIVEYSSPNIAKPFTIGHLRSTIIGHTLATLLTGVGYQVFRDNHLGDWGTQFGKLIYALKTWGDEATLDQSQQPVKELVQLYVKFHQEAEADPALEDEGRAWFKRLEDGDPEARRVWQKCIDWSWQEFGRLYQRLGVSFTENNGRGYGESYFENKMEPVLDELKAKGLVTESDGAKLVFFPQDELPPLMVVKKDGATLYATRDLATDKFRFEQYGPDVKIINEVGAEQALYFQQLFKLEQMLGWCQADQRVHVKHGLYRFKDQKMSTRKGNVIWLDDVLEQAFETVKKQARNPLDDETYWKIAVAALKWHDLKRESVKDIVFDFEEMLSIQGNTGPYLLYTLVRCQSILEKAQQEIGDVEKYIANHLDSERCVADEAELTVLKLGLMVPEAAVHAAEELSAHYLCTALFDLAQAFNHFYTDHLVVQADQPELTAQRLEIVRHVSLSIQKSMDLLGIDTVQKM